MERTPDWTLNASVSSESMDVPAYQPSTDRRPTMSRNGGAARPGERLLVLTPGDRGGAEPHPRRVLDAQVAEPAEAEDRDEVARPGTAVAQRVERCHAGAHQRRGVWRGQLRGHPCEGRRRGDQVVGVAAVERDASHLRAGLAGEKVAATAVVAGEAVPGVPTDADALAGLPPLRDVLAHGVDHTDHLVPRDARKGDAGPLALLGKDIAVADAAGLDLDPHGPWSRVGDRAPDDLEGPAGARDLGDTHRVLEDVHIGLL